MQAQTLMAKIRTLFTNNYSGTVRKEKAMKRLIAAMALAALGLSTPAYAEPVNIFARRIASVHIQNNYTRIYLHSVDNGQPIDNTCGGNVVGIFEDDPLHDRVFVLFTTALTTGRTLIANVSCVGTRADLNSLTIQ